MKNFGMFLLASMIFFSCETKHEERQEDSTTVAPVITEKNSNFLDLGCYGFSDGKSTVMLEVTDNSSEVKGHLSYELAEKDRNVGEFTGEIKNNILLATYTFQSEGMTSKRTVAFKIDGNRLIEGYGEMNADGTSFVDLNNITYTSTMPLVKGRCEK